MLRDVSCPGGTGGSQVDLSERGPERKAEELCTEGKPMDLRSVALSMECVCVRGTAGISIRDFFMQSSNT